MANEVTQIKVEVMTPGSYHADIQDTRELVTRFPQFKGILDHKDFFRLDYQVGDVRTRFSVVLEQDTGDAAL